MLLDKDRKRDREKERVIGRENRMNFRFSA